jgi:hypothetical protein
MDGLHWFGIWRGALVGLMKMKRKKSANHFQRVLSDMEL